MAASGLRDRKRWGWDIRKFETGFEGVFDLERAAIENRFDVAFGQKVKFLCYTTVW
jgi:hypothetical protein